ncbi:MAG: hypothetical protein COA47_10095 [Robiginitomaculum sp.]|nr:MAG: hypothetical protein COA47_10095 [Robiginitomaculum sp.]
MPLTYITFGQNHAHSVNGKTFDKDCVATIECNSAEEGRLIAFATFGDKWCFCYFDTEFDHANLSYFPRGLISV